MKRKGETVLKAVRPNAGIAAAYREKLHCLIDAMARSYAYWMRAAYRANEPAVIAMDATPAWELQRVLRRLGIQWQRQFNEAAPELAKYFATKTARRSEAALRDILKRGGFSVEFRMTPAMQDIFRATVIENTGLIKSIPQQFHTEVQGLVMRSVQSGRDLAQLTDDLQDRFAITRKRAVLIARDQNNKATSSFTRARQTEVGIEYAIWQHSHAGKKPRRTHVANDGKRYKVAEGWYDPDPRVQRNIWPGELISCRCSSRPIVKGFS